MNRGLTRRIGGVLAGVFVAVLLVSSSDGARAQTSLDYFAASNDPDTRHALKLLEEFHLNHRVMTDFREGRYHYVAADLKFILDRMSNHPKALAMMAAVAVLSKKPTMAIPYFERAVRLHPQYTGTQVQYGRYLVHIGQVDEGLAKLQEVVRRDPQSGDGYAGLATGYFKHGDLERGRDAAGKARELGYRAKIEGE